MAAGWCCRTVRAAVFAAVCVLLAALGHVLMSGAPVSWWTMAAGAAGTGGAAWVLAGRERGFVPVATFSVAAQAVLHTMFSLAQRAQQPRPEPGGTHGPMPVGAVDHDMGASAPMDHVAHAAHMSSGAMLAAHLLAALLCGLWLAHGEQAVFRILRAVPGWLAAPLRLPLVVPAPAHRPRTGTRRTRSARRPRQFLLVHAITSRGPPAEAAVV